jgi:signal transduction histidine kinase/heme-degrading monooxygenase HmoA
MFAAISRFRVANGMDSSVAEAFRNRPRAVDAVPGFLGLDVFTAADDPSVFYLYTRWTDRESFDRWHHSDAHRESHALIPKGLKLDPAWTQITGMERIDGVIGSPLAEAVEDATLLATRVAEQSPGVHLIRLAADGTILTCNPAACHELAGGESLDGRLLADFMPEADAARLRHVLAAQGRSEHAVTLNFGAPHRTPYSLDCWFDVQPGGATLVGHPAFRRDQLLHDSLMAMNQELAVLSRERSRQASEAQRQQQEAERINEERNEFLTVLVHELRQPLGAAAAALGVLRKMDSDTALARPRNHLERQLLQIQRLVEDLNDSARLAGGTIDLRRIDLDLAAYIRGLTPSWEATAEAEQKHFQWRAPETPLMLSGDPHRLQQVFSNLVSNAFKDTVPGGSVSLAMTRDGDTAVVTVTDDGEGIPPDRLATVFELFKRATSTASGLGVGLAVVRGLVEAHDGSVTVASEGIGKGATFTVRLPLLPA